jgi:serine/threonine protein kinase
MGTAMVDKTISHRCILDNIGEGEMGVVYKAEDTNLHHTAALPRISPAAKGLSPPITFL